MIMAIVFAVLSSALVGYSLGRLVGRKQAKASIALMLASIEADLGDN